MQHLAHLFVLILPLSSLLIFNGCKTRSYNQKTSPKSASSSNNATESDGIDLSLFLSDYCKNAADEINNCSLSPFNIWTTLQAVGPALSLTQKPAYDAVFSEKLNKELKITFEDIEAAKENNPNGFKISALQNSWVQSGLELSDQAKSMPGLRQIDFKKAFTPTINQYIEDHTNPKILNLLPSSLDASDTGFVQTGVLSLKDTWIEEPGVVSLNFTSGSGKEKKAPFLNIRERVRATKTPSGTKIATTYFRSGEIFVTFVQYPESSAALNLTELNDFAQKMNNIPVTTANLYVPSFKIDMKKSFDVIAQLRANPTLAPLFSEELNLYKNSASNKNLRISNILHKTFIAFNEKGIEASAATAVVASRSMGPNSKDFYFDGPFYFVVSSGRVDEFGYSPSTILFMGKVNEI